MLPLRHLPNAITVTRLLIGIGALYTVITGDQSTALVLFIIATAGDKLDGVTARALNVTSTFGRFMDGFVDAFLILAMLPALVITGLAPQFTLLFLLMFVMDLVFLSVLAHRVGRTSVMDAYFDETPWPRKIMGVASYGFSLSALSGFHVEETAFAAGGFLLACSILLGRRMVLRYREL